MKNYRIGNTLTIKWTLKQPDGTAYELNAGKVKLFAATPNHRFEVTDFTVSSNVITWRFDGDKQKYPGPYTLTLEENRGEVDMVTVDFCNVFGLVEYSCLAGGTDTPGVTVEAVEISSEVSMSQIGLSPEVKALIEELISGFVGQKTTDGGEIFNDYENNQATGLHSHAEGGSTKASNSFAHAEGGFSEASGTHAHVEGLYTKAAGPSTHSEGTYTLAQNPNEHAQGSWNKSNTGETDAEKTVHSVGIGASGSRKNAVEVMVNGDMYIIGAGGYDGTNPGTGKTIQTVLTELNNTLGDISTILDNINGEVA